MHVSEIQLFALDHYTSAVHCHGLKYTLLIEKALRLKTPDELRQFCTEVHDLKIKKVKLLEFKRKTGDCIRYFLPFIKKQDLYTISYNLFLPYDP